MGKCKAIYQCMRCGAYLSVDADLVDTGRKEKEVFVRQTIFHDCLYGGAEAVFVCLTGTQGGN